MKLFHIRKQEKNKESEKKTMKFTMEYLSVREPFLDVPRTVHVHGVIKRTEPEVKGEVKLVFDLAEYGMGEQLSVLLEEIEKMVFDHIMSELKNEQE